MISFFYVFLGGGLGSMARYGFTFIFNERASGFPWATFGANMISCLILGLLLGIQMNSGLSDQRRLLLATGFCGGFSTFSTLSAELFTLLQQQQYNTVILYFLSSILTGLLMIILGFRIVMT